MCLRCFLPAFFILFNLAEASAQVNSKFEYPMNKVVKMSIDDGMDVNNPGATPSYSVTFNSNDSLVYAINSGEVISVTLVDSIQILVVKNEDTVYAYSNLKTVSVKNGDKISNAQIIGYADFDDNKSCYVLDFIMSKGQDILQLKKKNFVPRSL
jgi:hypothetical protein